MKAQATRNKIAKQASVLRMICEGLAVGLVFWGLIGSFALYKLGQFG